MRAKTAFDPRLLPRTEPPAAAEERIWRAVITLIPRLGIQCVSIQDIAHLAKTNTQTVLKYVGSKDELIIEYLNKSAETEESCWREIDQEHPGNPQAQLVAWLEWVQIICVDRFANEPEISKAAAELWSSKHAALAVIRKHRLRQREQLASRCRDAGYREPEGLGDKLFMLAEGARAGMQSIGRNGPALLLMAAAETLMASHK